jgi:hypothetical protein
LTRHENWLFDVDTPYFRRRQGGGAMGRFTFLNRFTFLFAAVFVISLGTAISYLISPP